MHPSLNLVRATSKQGWGIFEFNDEISCTSFFRYFFLFLPVILLGTGVSTWSLLFRISGLLGSKGNELIHLRDHSESRDAYFLK